MWHPLEYCIWCSPLQYKKDVKIIESVTKRAKKLVKRLKGMSCEYRLRTLGLSNMEKRRLRGDLIALFNFLRRKSGEGGASLFFLLKNIGGLGTTESCTKGGSDQILGKVSLM